MQMNNEIATAHDPTPLIYISGPYRASTEDAIHENIMTARFWAIAVWEAGGYAICPHLNTYLFGGRVGVDHILAGDFEMVRRCDAVLLIGDWENSEGAKLERDVAVANGIPVFTCEDLDTVYQCVSNGIRTMIEEGTLRHADPQVAASN